MGELPIAIVASLVGMVCLWFARRLYRKGGATHEEDVGLQYFRGRGLRATIAGLAYLSFAVGCFYLAFIVIARELGGG